MLMLQHVISVGYDISYNSYHWLRPPHIQKYINLDNHEVDIKEYTFTYNSGEGDHYPSYILSGAKQE